MRMPHLTQTFDISSALAAYTHTKQDNEQLQNYANRASKTKPIYIDNKTQKQSQPPIWPSQKFLTRFAEK